MKKNYQQPNIQTVVLQPLHIIAGTGGLPANKPNPGVQNPNSSSRQNSFDVWEAEEEEEQ